MSRRSHRTHEHYEPRRIIDPARRWYVAATFGVASLDDEASDRAADAALRKAGVDVWMPQRRITTTRRGRVVQAEALFFPGYLFCGLADDDTRGLRACRHVATVLAWDRQPLCVPAPVIQAVADRITGDVRSQRMQAAALYRVGELRQVMSGPFASFYAMITAVLKSGMVEAEVEVFGRRTPVQFEPGMLAET